ncbi:hypothetical protein FJZ55_09725 [Candidatus Woesearchaeota archaeon]|nr:hypothetical protein [Candidatus Woesearchaeota archaeon]
MNEELTQMEQELLDMLDKRAHTELMLGEKINSTLLNKAIDMIRTIAKERAYWQFKAECYKKDISKLSDENDKLYNDKWTDKGNYE